MPFIAGLLTFDPLNPDWVTAVIETAPGQSRQVTVQRRFIDSHHLPPNEHNQAMGFIACEAEVPAADGSQVIHLPTSADHADWATLVIRGITLTRLPKTQLRSHTTGHTSQ